MTTKQTFDFEASIYTVVECAHCDGGVLVVRISEGEDCCAAARRAGGICQHGGLRGGGHATWEECLALLTEMKGRVRG